MISIIIPVFNNHEMTEECIDSVIDSTGGDDYEIIIVDNGSEPPFPNFSRKTDKIIRNEKNLGFPAAVNQGIRAATREVICLLNNDTVVTPGWLDRLTLRLDEYAIVSSVTNYSAGMQRVVINAYDDVKSLNKASEEWSKKYAGRTLDVQFIIGFVMVFKKSLYDELGEFDESMWPCSGEEVDFCMRAGAAGYRVGIAQDVYIHHHGSKTFDILQRNGELNYSKVCKNCQDHLVKKWGVEFWNNQGVVPSKKDLIRLNLGCGGYKLPGFINIDESETVNPDVVANALSLGYEQNSVDEIYCGHMLEHLTYENGKDALIYWKKLLKPGGKITITVPDFDVLASDYLSDPTAEKLQILNDRYIYSYCQRSHHKYCYSATLLKKTMADCGLVQLKKQPHDHPYFADRVKWQVAYSGRK